MAIGLGTATAIAAAGQLGGALLGSRGQNRATDANERATREALAFEREREAQRRKEYEERLAMERAAWEAEQARREPYRRAAAGVLARYGYGAPSRPTFTPGSGAASAAAPRGAPMRPAPTTLGGLTTRPSEASVPVPTARPRLTVGNLQDWNRWGTYGTR